MEHGGAVGGAAGDGPRRRGHHPRTTCGPPARREAIADHLRELVDDAARGQGGRSSARSWTLVERLVLLRTIDSLWVEHLTELDDMRRGIGLRGYAQQDPLNEFRKEAFRLYEELRDLIRHQVATTIFRVTVRRQPAPVPLPGPGSPPASATAPRRRCRGDRAAAGGAARRRHRERRSRRPRASAAAAAARADHSPADRRRLPPVPTPPTRPPCAACPADPMRSAARCRATRGASGSARPGYTPTGRPDRPQRSLLVRVRPEVQEVPRA